jgi:hypothetical protein
VLKKEATNSVFTLVCIGLTLKSLYKYYDHSDDTGNKIVDDNDEELEEQQDQPNEEQSSVD